MSGLEGIYHQLRATVLLLSSSPDIQARYLAHASEQAKTTVLADDIAEDLHHWVRCAAQLTETPLLQVSTLNALESVDQAFEAIGPETEGWMLAALQTSPQWALIRKRAGEILAVMDDHYPAGVSGDLPGGTWVPAARP